MADNSIISLGDLSKPADTLINKISDAIGGLAKPFQIKRLAKAQAEADIIKAESEIEIEGRKRRAITRFIAEETKKQENIEQITEKAIPLLNQTASPQNMDNDWITNFFDKCRLISDEKMQLLWSKILAGEANAPGSYSKRTVDLLGIFSQKDAELFNTLICFSGYIDDGTESKDLATFIFDVEENIFNSNNISFRTLLYLEEIELINFEPKQSFQVTNLGKTITVIYQGQSLDITFSKTNNNSLVLGQVLLTKTAEELSNICTSKPIDGFFNYISEFWTKQGLIVTPKNTKTLLVPNNEKGLCRL